VLLTYVIDLHAHLLSGLDDGPQTLAQAVELCRTARLNGITRAVACPHALGHYDTNPARVADGLRELQERLREEYLDLELKAGMECWLSPELPERIRAGKVLTLGGSRYIGVEFPFTAIPAYADEVLFRVRAEGLTPVLFHPERTAEFVHRPDRLEKYVRSGSFVVMNAGSLLGAYGRAVRQGAIQLLKRGLVHALATDAHGNTARAADFGHAFEVAARVIGEGQARRLREEFPAAVWDDLPYWQGSRS
jgi:protein-tyrosine phosphatase